MNHYSHYEPLNLHRIVSSKQYQAMRHESILTASRVSIHRPCSKKIMGKGGFEVPKPCFHGGSLTHWQILTSHSETIQKPFRNLETGWDWTSQRFQALARFFSSMMSPARVAWPCLSCLRQRCQSSVSLLVIPCLGLTIYFTYYIYVFGLNKLYVTNTELYWIELIGRGMRRWYHGITNDLRQRPWLYLCRSQHAGGAPRSVPRKKSGLSDVVGCRSEQVNYPRAQWKSWKLVWNSSRTRTRGRLSQCFQTRPQNP